jgi:hypothetical protein
MHRLVGEQTSGPLRWIARGPSKWATLAACIAVLLIAYAGPATASAPLRVCATCQYADVSTALAAAAADVGDNTIQIGPGHYPDAISVSSDVSLVGAGSEQTTIGKVAVEVGVSVTINGLTVDGGPSGLPDNANGIKNAGMLTLKSSVISGNVALSGAGILNESTGTATLQDSTLIGNDALLGSGGAILNLGAMTLRGTSVVENSAFGSGGGALNQGTLTLQGSLVRSNGAFTNGGGIANYGLLTVRDSAIEDNLSVAGGTGGGGGIYNSATATAILTSARVSENEVLIDDGGGIANSGTLTLRDSTVDGNSASNRGGGIFNGGTGDVTLRGSAVIGNSAPTGPGIFNDGGALTIRGSTIQT